MTSRQGFGPSAIGNNFHAQLEVRNLRPEEAATGYDYQL
jgi:hypothetical protein